MSDTFSFQNIFGFDFNDTDQFDEVAKVMATAYLNRHFPQGSDENVIQLLYVFLKNKNIQRGLFHSVPSLAGIARLLSACEDNAAIRE